MNQTKRERRRARNLLLRQLASAVIALALASAARRA
jgi:hypothetical protein